MDSDVIFSLGTMLGLFILIGFGCYMSSMVEIEKEETKRKCCGGGCHEEKNDD